MSSSRKYLFVHWIPALIGISVILAESTVTMSAENTSRWLLPLWIKLFGPISPAHWAVVHHYIRKTGHFLGYGTISLCFFEGWRVTLAAHWGRCRIRFRQAALLAMGCTVLLASWDEWHQSFLPGRTSAPKDVLLDSCGALAAQLVLLGVTSLWQKRSTERLQMA